MPDKDPQTYSNLSLVIMFAASLLGGAVRWLQKFRNPKIKVAWTVMELLASIGMALIVGAAAFAIAERFRFSVGEAVAAISLAGYFGGETMKILWHIGVTKLRAIGWLPPDDESKS